MKRKRSSEARIRLLKSSNASRKRSRVCRFGSVEVVIQDGRVIQIERKEKFRFDRPNRS